MFVLFFTIKRTQLLKNLSLTSLEEVSFVVFFFFFSSPFPLLIAGNIGICDEPKCEIGHSSFVYCSPLWCSLSSLEIGVWTLTML